MKIETLNKQTVVTMTSSSIKSTALYDFLNDVLFLQYLDVKGKTITIDMHYMQQDYDEFKEFINVIEDKIEDEKIDNEEVNELSFLLSELHSRKIDRLIITK